jgi:putative oxidoreductase
MKKLLSIKYSAGAFNTALLILRLVAGIWMLQHGYEKLTQFDKTAEGMINFLGIGQKASTVLVIFSEFFCSCFLILGLFTRFATIPLIITMVVAMWKMHHNDYLGESDISLFIACYLAILLLGPGKISIDGMISK